MRGATFLLLALARPVRVQPRVVHVARPGRTRLCRASAGRAAAHRSGAPGGETPYAGQTYAHQYTCARRWLPTRAACASRSVAAAAPARARRRSRRGGVPSGAVNPYFPDCPEARERASRSSRRSAPTRAAAASRLCADHRHRQHTPGRGQARLVVRVAGVPPLRVPLHRRQEPERVLDHVPGRLHLGLRDLMCGRWGRYLQHENATTRRTRASRRVVGGAIMRREGLLRGADLLLLSAEKSKFERSHFELA